MPIPNAPPSIADTGVSTMHASMNSALSMPAPNALVITGVLDGEFELSVVISEFVSSAEGSGSDSVSTECSDATYDVGSVGQFLLDVFACCWNVECYAFHGVSP